MEDPQRGAREDAQEGADTEAHSEGGLHFPADDPQKFIYSALLSLLGYLPWTMLVLLSLPWSVVYLVWCQRSSNGEGMRAAFRADAMKRVSIGGAETKLIPSALKKQASVVDAELIDAMRDAKRASLDGGSVSDDEESEDEDDPKKKATCEHLCEKQADPNDACQGTVKTRQDLLEAREDPMHASEASTSAARDPIEAREDLADAWKARVETRRASNVETREDPTDAWKAQVETREETMEAREDPVDACEASAGAGQDPIGAREDPSEAREVPTDAWRAQAETRGKPMDAREDPIYASEASTETAQDSIEARDDPSEAGWEAPLLFARAYGMLRRQMQMRCMEITALAFEDAGGMAWAQLMRNAASSENLMRSVPTHRAARPARAHHTPAIHSRNMFWCHICSIFNIVTTTCALWYYGLLMTDPGWLEALVSYVYCFAIAATWRSSYRMRYGFNSNEAKEFDEGLLAVFGVYLVQRGSTSKWVYPVLSMMPAYLVYSLVYWFTRKEFPVSCSPGVNNTFVLDHEHCHLFMTVWDMHAMLQYVAADIVFMYGMLRALALFLVRMDPDATGTLSELKAWEDKMITNQVMARMESKRD